VNRIFKRFNDIRGWLPAYFKWLVSDYRRERPKEAPIDIVFVFVDHYEPAWNKALPEEEIERVTKWTENYASSVADVVDSDGRPPQHTWFYPYDEINLDCLHMLSGLCYDGFGEIELHLHHFNDNSERLRAKLHDALEQYGRVGALVSTGNPLKNNYAFIHGNWALDNSIPNFCGVNDELLCLKESGCFADFTFPAPNQSQPAMVNNIYYAVDDPERPKSYNTGRVLDVSDKNEGDLVIFQGPLILDYSGFSFLPKIDDGEIDFYKRFDRRRLNNWLEAGIHVSGKPDWIFIKLFTHGAAPAAAEILLGGAGKEMHRAIAECLNATPYRLHFMTAREAYNTAMAACEGRTGNPNDYRGYIVKPYLNSRIRCNRLYRPIRFDDTAIALEIIDGEDTVSVEFDSGVLRRAEGMIESLEIHTPDSKTATIKAAGIGEITYDIISAGVISGMNEENILAMEQTEHGFEYKVRTYDTDGIHRLELKIG